MIEVVVVTSGGEASMSCTYGDVDALAATVGRLVAILTDVPVSIVEWFVRPARGYTWA